MDAQQDYNIELLGDPGYKRTTPLTIDERLNRDLLVRYDTNDRKKWIQNFQDNIAFKNNVQWNEADAAAQKAANQPFLSINEVTPALEVSIAALTENEPRFMAYGREASDVGVAHAESDVLEYVWQISDGNVEAKQTIEDSKVGGMGAWIVYKDHNADWGDGEIKIASVDPRYLYIDPNSKKRNSKDASNILLTGIYNAKEIMSMAPDFDLTQALPDFGYNELPQSGGYLGDSVLESTDLTTRKKYRLIDRYAQTQLWMFKVWQPRTNFRKILNRSEYIKFGQSPAIVLLKTNTPPVYVTDPLEVKKEIEMYNQTGGSFHLIVNPETLDIEPRKGVPDSQFALPATYTQIKIVTMTDLLNAGILKYKKIQIPRIKRVLTIGLKEYVNEIMPIESHPIITLMRYHNRCPYPQGDMQYVRPLQEELNKVHSLIIAYNVNLVNRKVFLPTNAGINKEDVEQRWGAAGAQIFWYDPSDAGSIPVFAPVDQMNNGFYQQAAILISQIQRILGSYPAQDGDMAQAPRTKGGTFALLEAGNTRTRSEQHDIEAAINQVATVVADLIPNVYTEQKIIRLRKPNNKIKEVWLNKPEQDPEDDYAFKIINDVTVTKKDIVMLTGSMLPTNRIAKSEYYLNLYKEGVLQDPEPILRMSEIDNVDEVIAKQDKVRQLESALQQAQDQIKQLGGQLQTTTREAINANKRTEVEKFKTKLNRSANEAAASVQMTKSKLEMSVKDFENSLKAK